MSSGPSRPAPHQSRPLSYGWHLRKASVLALLVLSCLLAPLGEADGLSFAKKGSGWEPMGEHMQSAVIRCENGRQRMLVSIELDLAHETEALWILPVRGRPSEVQIEMASIMPGFLGRDPWQHLQGQYANAVGVLALTQSQLLPMAIIVPWLSGSMLGASRSARSHHLVQRHGLEVRSVTAGNVVELGRWLAEQGKTIDPKLLASFAPYCNDSHTLLVANIASQAQLLRDFPEYQNHSRRNRIPCLAVEFPCPQPWFPLMASAGAPDQQMAVFLQVLGLVTPHGPKNVITQAQLTHRKCWPRWSPEESQEAATPIGGSRWVADWLKIPPEPRVAVTGFIWSGSPKELTQDLEFVPTTSVIWQVADALGQPSVLLPTIISLHFVGSVLAGFLAGWILLRRPSLGMQIGLCNAVSLAISHAFLRRHWLKIAQLKYSYQYRKSAMLTRNHVPAGALFLFLIILGHSRWDCLPAVLAVVGILFFLYSMWSARRIPATPDDLLCHQKAVRWRVMAFHRRALLPLAASWLYATLLGLVGLLAWI